MLVRNVTTRTSKHEKNPKSDPNHEILISGAFRTFRAFKNFSNETLNKQDAANSQAEDYEIFNNTRFEVVQTKNLYKLQNHEITD